MMNDFDIIIPIAKNDVEALKNNLPYIRKLFSNNTITIIANNSVKNEFQDYPYLHFVDENKMIDEMTFNSIKQLIESKYPKAARRTGWYFQQFLKLGYARICKKKYYLSWDSDTIPLNNLCFFGKDGKPYLDYVDYVKEDKAYDKTIQTLWDDNSVFVNNDFSFITEHMMFSTDITKCMINEIENNAHVLGNNYAEKIINAIAIDNLNLSGFSEFETYSAYIRSKHSEEYQLRNWRNVRHGKSFFGNQINDKQIKWVSEYFDAISIEDFDHQLFLSRFLCSERMTHKVSFKLIFDTLSPLIDMLYFCRMKIRSVVRK